MAVTALLLIAAEISPIVIAPGAYRGFRFDEEGVELSAIYALLDHPHSPIPAGGPGVAIGVFGDGRGNRLAYRYIEFEGTMPLATIGTGYAKGPEGEGWQVTVTVLNFVPFFPFWRWRAHESGADFGVFLKVPIPFE